MSIFEKVFKGEETVANEITRKAAFRLGKLKENGLRRPLKMVLGAKTQAEEVFRRSYRPKDDPMRLLRDLEPEERSRLKDALMELRERQSQGEDNLIIRDFRVVRKRLQLKWPPFHTYSAVVRAMNGS
ncbi:unnamed protein product [Echinostoma caproni]|uniref:39S ribosomal protein L17, mitochondrial n=1 Tax=Echinostoma caproni TaxID=27848 RepID=A0A183A180_9TREM|nr:unnamed protein product [Echinostoma caproni]